MCSLAQCVSVADCDSTRPVTWQACQSGRVMLVCLSVLWCTRSVSCVQGGVVRHRAIPLGVGWRHAGWTCWLGIVVTWGLLPTTVSAGLHGAVLSITSEQTFLAYSVCYLEADRKSVSAPKVGKLPLSE